MEKMKIEIHEEKDCAWCELPYPYWQFIYGKNTAEMKAALEALRSNEKGAGS